jgi:hypothetical protein
VNGPYNSSGIGLELNEVAKRRFLASHGIDRVAARTCQRSGLPLGLVYRRILSALSTSLRPEDLVIFAEAFEREEGTSRAELADAARSLQRSHLACRVAEHYLRLSTIPIDAILPALKEQTPQAERLALKVLESAKATFRAGDAGVARQQLLALVPFLGAYPSLALSGRYYLALAHETSGDLEAAREQFEATLSLEPTHGKAREGLARLRAATAPGDTAEREAHQEAVHAG